MDLRVAPVVEGHGEVASVRPLLQRIGAELLDGAMIDVMRPVRVPRTRIAHPSHLTRAIDLAALLLARDPHRNTPEMVLLLLDTDPDPRLACEVGPEILDRVTTARANLDVAVVLAHPEWETWFVAASRSLARYLDLPDTITPDPEASRTAKGWIKQHFRGHYSETTDQPKLTARMDLDLCRKRSPSFDKLCREIEKRLPPRSDE